MAKRKPIYVRVPVTVELNIAIDVGTFDLPPEPEEWAGFSRLEERAIRNDAEQAALDYLERKVEGIRNLTAAEQGDWTVTRGRTAKVLAK